MLLMEIIVPQQSIPGDINGDGIINILDVIQTVNIILGVSDVNLQADINDDGIVNILDVVILIDMILS